MPNIKSAKKRVLVASAKSERNKALKTACKTAIKKYNEAVASGDKTAAEAAYKLVVKKIDHATAKGIYHKNNAARKKSQYTRKLASIGA